MNCMRGMPAAANGGFAVRARYSATRKRKVLRADVIDHVGSGWNAQRRANDDKWVVGSPSVDRSDVRSARVNRPCTGSRTSAISAANTASADDSRQVLTPPLESPRGCGAIENEKEGTSD